MDGKIRKLLPLLATLSLFLILIFIFKATGMSGGKPIEISQLNISKVTAVESKALTKYIEEKKKEIETKVKEESRRKKEEEKKKMGYDPEKPIAYLTFDDGPSRYLSEILDVLNKHKAKGTFFFIGSSLGGLTESMVKNIKDNKHSVASHSYTHNRDALYRNNQFIQENERTFKLLKEKGFRTNTLRAPYGSTYASDQQLSNARAKGWKIMDWHVDSRDWELKNAKKIYDLIIKQVKNLKPEHKDNVVILMHERRETAATLELLIPKLKEMGYQLISEENRPMDEYVMRGR